MFKLKNHVFRVLIMIFTLTFISIFHARYYCYKELLKDPKKRNKLTSISSHFTVRNFELLPWEKILLPFVLICSVLFCSSTIESVLLRKGKHSSRKMACKKQQDNFHQNKKKNYQQLELEFFMRKTSINCSHFCKRLRLEQARHLLLKKLNCKQDREINAKRITTFHLYHEV